MYLPSCGHEKARSVVKVVPVRTWKSLARVGARRALDRLWRVDQWYEGRRGPDGIGVPNGEAARRSRNLPPKKRYVIGSRSLLCLDRRSSRRVTPAAWWWARSAAASSARPRRRASDTYIGTKSSPGNIDSGVDT
jgi:hypothetical protein